MNAVQLISAKEFCLHHHIEVHFLHSLHQFGLIEIAMQEDDCFLHPDQLAEIEKMIRLHYDLQVNFEGIDVIQNLLHKIEAMEEEMVLLKNKLRLYEGNT